MALKNVEGNYLRITHVDPNRLSVSTKTWKDEATRQSPSEFDAPQTRTHDVAGIIDISASADSSKSIQENLITAGYVAIKQLDSLAEFNIDA